MDKRAKIIDLLTKIRVLKKSYYFLNCVILCTLIILFCFLCVQQDVIINSLKYIFLIFILCFVLNLISCLLLFQLNKLYNEFYQQRKKWLDES